MSGVTVEFYIVDEQPANHLDGGGCVWHIAVGAAGQLKVYQEPVFEEGVVPVPIVLAEHVYAAGSWRSAVRM